MVYAPDHRHTAVRERLEQMQLECDLYGSGVTDDCSHPQRLTTTCWKEQTMAKNEIWLPIPGYKGYEASNLGRVRSIDRKLRNGHRWKGRILKTPPDGHGYAQVALGKYTKFKVHCLVLLVFRGKRRNKKVEARHLDGKRMNNRLGNLQYGSRSDNALDRERHRRKKNRAQDTKF